MTNEDKFWQAVKEAKKCEKVSNIEDIKRLNLYSNKLTSLPSEISKLKNLKYLILSNNKLASLPSEVCKLKNLKYLYLKNNPLDFKNYKTIEFCGKQIPVSYETCKICNKETDKNQVYFNNYFHQSCFKNSGVLELTSCFCKTSKKHTYKTLQLCETCYKQQIL